MQEFGFLKMDQFDLKGALMNRIKKNDEGFTLVEVMIAICVLAIGLLAIASMQVGAANTNANARDISEAVTVAEQQMEILMSLPYPFAQVQDDQNPDALQDVNGDGAAGLLNPFPNNAPTFDAENLDPVTDPAGWFAARPPDHQGIITTEKRTYTIFWNVAEEVAMVNTKSIQVLVTWDNDAIGRYVAIRRVIPRIG